MLDQSECPYCGHTITDLTDYHMEQHEAITVTCEDCGKDFEIICCVFYEAHEIEIVKDNND